MNSKKISIVSMIAASSCCLPPLILLGLTLIGVGTAGLAGLSSTLGSLKWFILPLAVVGVGVSYWLYFREKKKCSTQACRMTNEKLTKTMLTISTTVVLGFLYWSVYPYVLGTSPLPGPHETQSAHFVVYSVEGMTCGGCEIAVDGAINATGLADSVKSSFIDCKVYVWYSATETNLKEFENAIQSVGFELRLPESH